MNDTAQNKTWEYLEPRSHPWRRQFYVKELKIRASTIWQDMTINGMSPEEAAENWNVPLALIYEVILYCESHQELLKLEADEERIRLESKGISLEPKVIEIS
jgi:uncharacterized protein (DUF433 family)